MFSACVTAEMPVCNPSAAVNRTMPEAGCKGHTASGSGFATSFLPGTRIRRRGFKCKKVRKEWSVFSGEREFRGFRAG